MTPPDPNYTEPLTAFGAPLLAAKPIFWFAGVVAAGTLFGSALLNRVERIESDVQTIKYIVCASAPASTDTACKDHRR